MIPYIVIIILFWFRLFISIILFTIVLILLIKYNQKRRQLKHSITVDLVLRNAVIEAYEYAVETHNTFEIEKYKQLVSEVKGRQV